MIEKILLFLLIILLALLVANIAIKSICIITSKVNHNILKYGGMSPIDISYKDEISIPIFLNPIDKKIDKKMQLFALSDLYDDKLIDKLSNKSLNAKIDGGDGSDDEDDGRKSKKSRPTISRPNLLPLQRGGTSYQIVSNQLKKLTALPNIMITETIDRADGGSYSYNILDNNSDDVVFLTVLIYPSDNNNITLGHLQKTDDFSGLQLLNWVTDLAILLQSEKISLEDVSEIKYDFVLDENTLPININYSLYCFCILQNGKSWYNKLGYYGVNYSYELENNSSWISKTYQQFLTDLLNAFLTEFESIDSVITAIAYTIDARHKYGLEQDDKKFKTIYNINKTLLSLYYLRNKINEQSQDVFQIDIYVLNYDDAISDAITKIFNALLFIVQQYNPEINENTPIHEIFQYINQIIKDNVQLEYAQLEEDQLNLRKKYLLLLIFLNAFINIISNLMNYFVILKRENPAITWSFLYYDCFDNDGDQLVKTFIYTV